MPKRQRKKALTTPSSTPTPVTAPNANVFLAAGVAIAASAALLAFWQLGGQNNGGGGGTIKRKQGERFTLLPPVTTSPGVRRFHVPVQLKRSVVDAEIVAVDNFLPLGIAERWRDQMDQHWSSAYSQGNFQTLDPADTTGWLYTTNDLNSKSRGNDNIVNRSILAERSRQAGQFSYSKWELAPEHDLVQEIKAYLASKEIREKVQALVGSKELNGALSDIFVTQFAPSNFLTQHNDGYSGTWAIVLSLATSSPKWQQGYGGELAFKCHAELGTDLRGANQDTCRKLGPKFNSVVLFRTNNPAIGPPHQVLPVASAAGEAGFRRFGVTAWYTEVDEVMSEEFVRENRKMRGKLLNNK